MARNKDTSGYRLEVSRTESELEDMPATRKRLGHTAESQTAEYVRAKIGELVDPGAMQRPAFLANVQDSAKSLKLLEAGSGIEPLWAALQAAA